MLRFVLARPLIVDIFFFLVEIAIAHSTYSLHLRDRGRGAGSLPLDIFAHVANPPPPQFFEDDRCHMAAHASGQATILLLS